jgi:MFS family permease
MIARWQHIDPIRWNWWVLGMDITIYTFGIQISSFEVILPLFVASLTKDNWPITLIIALRNLGVFIPMLFIATYIERKPRMKHIMRRFSYIQRLPFLILSLSTLFFASWSPNLLLIIFLAMVFLHAMGCGLGVPPWMDIILRTIPSGKIVRFFGQWTGMGSFLGLGGAALALAYISTYPWPMNFALCFLTTFVFFMLSMASQQQCREPARTVYTDIPQSNGEESAPTGIKSWFSSVATIIREDSEFRRYLMGLIISSSASFSIGLITPIAIYQAHLTSQQISAEATVLVIGSICSNYLWGTIADRWNPRGVLLSCTFLMIVMLSVALIANSWQLITIVFFLNGFIISGVYLARQQFQAYFGRSARRPVYIGLMMLVIAPFSVLLPIIGGVLADCFGYKPIFLMDIALSIIAFIGIMMLIGNSKLATSVAQ